VKAPTVFAATSAASAATSSGASATAQATAALQQLADGAGKSSADQAGVDAVQTAAAGDADSADDADPTTDPQAAQNAAAQAAPAAPAASAEATVSQALAAEVRGSPQTVADLSAQIAKQLDSRSTQFDVQLYPAGLGQVNVRVAIGADGKMSASMSFDTQQAANELKSHASELQQSLEQSGFDLSGGMSFDVASGGGQGGQGQQQADSGAVFRGRAFQAAIDNSDAAAAPQLIPQRSARSGVDIRI
jgi:flagellar hook-length control protein FliK